MTTIFFTTSINRLFLTVLILVSLSVVRSVCAEDNHEKAAQIVAQIQRADYEGDRAAMQRGYDELQAFVEDNKLASRIRYWRGFAQWRRSDQGAGGWL